MKYPKKSAGEGGKGRECHLAHHAWGHWHGRPQRLELGVARSGLHGPTLATLTPACLVLLPLVQMLRAHPQLSLSAQRETRRVKGVMSGTIAALSPEPSLWARRHLQAFQRHLRAPGGGKWLPPFYRSDEAGN